LTSSACAAYGQAKIANALFAVQLDALGREAGVRAFSARLWSLSAELTGVDAFAAARSG
jgi:hypothetical protein